MRLIKITAPRGKGRDLAQLAFRCGITEVSLSEAAQHRPDEAPAPRDVVNAELATPQAKAYIDIIISAPWFNRKDYAIEVREARAILHDGRLVFLVFLPFLPFLPFVLAFGFGALTRQWRLVGHAFAAFVAATALITLGGVIVGSLADASILFDGFVPPPVGVAFSLLVGIAGALGTADDTGHRQLVGLAAASQLGVLPAWFGVSLISGFTDPVGEKLMSFGANFTAIALAATATYAVLALRGDFSYRLARRKEYEL